MSFAEIKKAINSNLAKPLNTLISELFTNTNSKIDTVNTNVTNTKTVATNAYNVLTNSTYGNNAIRTLLNTVNTNLTGGKVPVVKSVQRGMSSGYVYRDATSSLVVGNRELTINAVDPKKCLVILRNLTLYEPTYEARVVSLTQTKLTVTDSYTILAGDKTPRDFSWQVIEFY